MNGGKKSSTFKFIYAFSVYTRHITLLKNYLIFTCDITQCETNESKPVTKSIYLEKWGNGPVLPRAKFIRI